MGRRAGVLRVLIGVAMAAALGACAGGPAGDAAEPTTGRWVLVIHGGAGFVSPETAPERVEAYRSGLREALREGGALLASGATAVESVEAAVRVLEDDPLFNAGRGAVFTSSGGHELDASIMDGRTRACGAVTGVRTARHPITLARLVMERSPHVFFAGDGAEAFADRVGVERVRNSWFGTPGARASYERAREQRRRERGGGTVGAVALDLEGNLAAATSTGGLTLKAPGRIGDSPVIGAGTYASNASCAVSCTGQGELFIRNTVARDVAALVELRGMGVGDAARELIDERLEPGDGGLIAVSRTGEAAMVYSTGSMLRGVADSSGRSEVAIWDAEGG